MQHCRVETRSQWWVQSFKLPVIVLLPDTTTRVGVAWFSSACNRRANTSSLWIISCSDVRTRSASETGSRWIVDISNCVFINANKREASSRSYATWKPFCWNGRRQIGPVIKQNIISHNHENKFVDTYIHVNDNCQQYDQYTLNGHKWK